MIRLYDRDASDVARLLDTVAAFRFHPDDTKSASDAYNALIGWAPADVDTVPSRLTGSNDLPAFVAHRLTLIANAIRDQLDDARPTAAIGRRQEQRAPTP